MKRLLLSLLPFAAATGCALPQIKGVPEKGNSIRVEPEVVQGVEASARPWTKQKLQEPQLYSRDGSPVGVQETGTVAVKPEVTHAATQTDGSRWTLLEQYQDAIAANEELEFEVSALGEALDIAETQVATLTATNDELRGQMSDYEARIAALESENIELAARLTTAQVRRLQSEKLLLEAKLDWKRVEVAINQSEQPPAPGGGPAEAGPKPPGPKQQP